jgi:hypothetical protein
MLTPEQIMNNQIQKNGLFEAMKKAAELMEGGVAVYVPNAVVCCHIGVVKYDSDGEKFLEALGTGKTWEKAFSYLKPSEKEELVNMPDNSFDPEDKI